MNLLPTLMIMITLQRRPSNCLSSWRVVERLAAIFLAKSIISATLWVGMATVPESQSTSKPRARRVRAGGEMCPGVMLSLTLAASYTANKLSQAEVAQALCLTQSPSLM